MEGSAASEPAEPAGGLAAVRAVADRWIVDFGLVSLCHYFKEGQLERCRDCLRWLEAFLNASEELLQEQKRKLDVCSFLARVVDGKERGVQFENDGRITPLMSAVPLWDALQDLVVDKRLFHTIKKLLLVQAVAVCVERGDFVTPWWILDWMKEESTSLPNLKMKLSMILNMKDTYHTFLTTFSFVRLVDNIKVFLDQFLEDHPSDFIFKAASKVAQLSLVGQVCGEGMESLGSTEETSRMDEIKMELEKASAPERIVDVSTSNCKQGTEELYVQQNISSRGDQRAARSVRKSTKSTKGAKRAPKKKWTWEEDRDLKSGVVRYGVGKWGKILQEFDFGGRTGVMLKDRWRTLQKQGMVG